MALPGGESPPPEAQALADQHGVPAFAAARLSYRHGSQAPQILALAESAPDLRAQACPCEGVLLAELAFSLRSEFAQGLTDLRRRCRLAMGVCQGARCTATAAALWMTERQATAEAALQEAQALIDERWKGQRAVPAADMLAQAELSFGTWFTTGALPCS